MQAVILAGGEGTRLRPLTYEIPKPMIPINDKPFLEHLLNLLKKNNITRILLCIGYLGEKIKDYFGQGSKWGMSISYSLEDELLDTAGAIKKAEGLLEDSFLLLNGDTYLSLNYSELIEYFSKSEKIGVMAVCKKKGLPGKGSVQLENGFIVDYKKNNENDLGYLDAGVSIYSKKLLELIPQGRAVSLEKEIYPKLIASEELLGYLSVERFYDMGTSEELEILKEVLK
jgi:NDP-sugar pyrophosphorylase family protein